MQIVCTCTTALACNRAQVRLHSVDLSVLFLFVHSYTVLTVYFLGIWKKSHVM